MYSTGASALTDSSYSAEQYGLSGPVWFMVGIGMSLCFVGILIAQFRTRAPGAETFPQLMLARSAIFIYLLTMTLVITIKVFFCDETGLLASSTVEIAKRLLGPNGLFTLFSLYAFVVTTSTLLQITSITKILTFDIYAVHLRPFRVCYEVNCCIFCGKSKGQLTRPKDKCQCCDPAECLQCQEDLKSVTAESSDLPLSYDQINLVSNGAGIMCGFILPVIIVLASKESETEQSDAERDCLPSLMAGVFADSCCSTANTERIFAG
ncbi:Urea-proton symporter DUR3 [Taenia solium]|eukprot:TsM_000906500 transcript=TsM_000906500 gene=TsM_000906500